MKLKLPNLDYYRIIKHSAIDTNILFFILLILNYLHYLPEFWNTNKVYIWFFVVAVNTAFFSFKIKQIPENKRRDSRMVYLFSHFFLLSLLIIVLNQFLKRQIIIDFLPEIIAVSIGLGFLTFYAFRNRVEKEIEHEKLSEEKAEKKRYKEFNKKFPRINRIWGLRNIVRWGYKEGWVYVLILLAILIMFTAIKYPYFDVSFTGEHAMKYNSYVEPAKYMVENNNPFWNQKKYMADPINNPQGIFNSFGTLPIMEWGLFSTYKLFPNNSLEFNTRLFTNFLGVLILFFTYFFFKFWFLKKQSLLIVFLMAINPIISFATFVTVYDSLLILFMFISLIFLNKYFDNQNFKYLFFAGLFFGIGNACKYSLFLWYAPISLILIYYKKKDFSDFLKNSLIFLLLSLLPILTLKTSIRYLPSKTFKGIILLVVWIILYLILFKFIKTQGEMINKSFNLVKRNKVLFLMIASVLLILGFIFLRISNLLIFSKEFLTDSKLIFNFTMYKYMLLDQFRMYMTSNVFMMGLLGLFIVPLIKNKQIRIISLSFLIGSLIYWVSASKAMFFHNYYTMIIMILFCILISNIPIMFNNKKIITLFLIFVIIFSVSATSYDKNINRLSKERVGFLEASNYLREHTNPEDLYIDENYLLSLTIKTGRARVGSHSFLNNYEFKKSVMEIGFAETMKKYNIKYLITNEKTPRYYKFADIFSATPLQSTSYKRSDKINKKIGKSVSYFSDSSIRDKIIEENNLKEKFVLEEQIGNYRFFTFQN